MTSNPTFLQDLETINNIQDETQRDNAFQQLLDQLLALSSPVEREKAIRDLMFGLAKKHQIEQDDRLDWIRLVMDASSDIITDPAVLLEAMFRGFLTSGEIRNAHRIALRIPTPSVRDPFVVEVAQTWLKENEPVLAVKTLADIQNVDLRAEWILGLSLNEMIVTNPTACAHLFEVSVSVPSITQQAMQQIVEHPAFPHEAKLAIAELSPENDMKSTRVVVDCLHSYGENVHYTPRDHVQRNHFGEHVAGSRVTGWKHFDEMWDEIKSTVQKRVKDDGSVQVISLSFPHDIGTNALIPFEQASPNKLGVEERNGHPSLYCKANGQQFPTKQLTVVVGPSKIEANEIPNHDGHDLPCVLYTIYPGEAASPFPKWDTDDLPSLEASTQEALSLLQSGKIQEAKDTLYKALQQLNGSDEAAIFWSRHLLLK